MLPPAIPAAELGVRPMNVLRDAEVAPVGIPMTEQERNRDFKEVRTQLTSLRAAHIKFNRVEGNLGPNGSVAQLVNAETTYARRAGRGGTISGGRQGHLNTMANARTVRQENEADAAYDNREDIKANIRAVIARSDPDMFIGPSADDINGAAELEHNAGAHEATTRSAAQRMQNCVDERYRHMMNRIAYFNAHPTSDANEQLYRQAYVRAAVGYWTDTTLGSRSGAVVGDRPGRDGRPDMRRGADRLNSTHAFAEGLLAEFADLSVTMQDTYTGVFTEHLRLTGRAQWYNEAATLHMAGWRLGQEVSYPGQDAHLGVIFDVQHQVIFNNPNFSRRSSARAEHLEQSVVQRYRLEERLALRPNQALNTYPRYYTPEGGILVNYDPLVPNSGVVIYDDGSESRYDAGSGEWVRQMADGHEWVQHAEPTFEVPTFYSNGDYNGASDAQIEADVQARRDRWDELRTPDAERETLYMDRIHVDRMQQRHGEAQQAIDSITARIDDLDRARLDQRNRINAIKNKPEYAGKPESAYSVDDQGDLATARVQIVSIDTDLTARRAERATHIATQYNVRTRQNQSQYWLARHGVNEENLGAPGGTRMYEMRPNGAVLARDITINGRRGNWIVNPDGSTNRLNSTCTAVVESYRANGTLI